MFLFPRKRRKINILSVAVIILGIAGAAGTVFRVVGNPDAAQSLIGAASGIIVAFPAVIYTIIVAVCAAVCASAMPEYSVWAVAGTSVLEVCLVVGMILKYLTEGSLAEKDFLKLAKGYFARSYLVVRYRNIQYVRFSRNPLAKAFGIQKGEIHLLASSADTSHSIPYFKGNGEEIIKEGMLR